MKGILFVLAVGICLFSAYKTKLNYYQKMTVKAILAYLSAAALVLSLVVLISTGIGAGSVIKEDTLAERMERAVWYTGRGEFENLTSFMKYNHCYEKEFDHLWEQIDMYDEYHLYLIYEKGAQARAGKPEEELWRLRAEEHKQKLLEICKNSVFEENKPYAEYYGTVVWNGNTF